MDDRWHPRTLWHLLKEPRVITAMHLLGYAILTTAGAAALGTPPTSIRAEWGPLLTQLWGGGLLLGGAVALVATPRGWWWVERTGITLLIIALAMYLSVVVSLHYTMSGNRLPQAGVTAYAIISLVVRFLRIRSAALDPTAGPDGYHPDPDDTLTTHEARA